MTKERILPSPQNAFAKLLLGFLAPGLTVLALGGVAPSAAALDDQGIFVLSLAGREIGREKYSIRSSRGKIEAKAEIKLRVEQQGKVRNFKLFPTLILNSDHRPLTYTWRQHGPQSSSLEVDFRSSPAKIRYRTVAGQDDQRDFALPSDVLVLDDNVIHHYAFIVDRFTQASRGKQTFQAFVPQEALPGTLAVEEIGKEPVRIRGRSEVLQHLVVTTDLARIDLWVDDRDRLQLVSIPATQLEAVRKE